MNDSKADAAYFPQQPPREKSEMTTNEARAQRTVGGVIDRLTTDKSGLPVATRITQALNDAGLLTPDLPEPRTFPNGEKEWYTLDGWVNLDTDGAIAIVYDERDEDDIAAGVEIEPGELVFTKPVAAHLLGLALIAAADFAEKEKK